MSRNFRHHKGHSHHKNSESETELLAHRSMSSNSDDSYTGRPSTPFPPSAFLSVEEDKEETANVRCSQRHPDRSLLRRQQSPEDKSSGSGNSLCDETSTSQTKNCRGDSLYGEVFPKGPGGNLRVPAAVEDDTLVFFTLEGESSADDSPPDEVAPLPQGIYDPCYSIRTASSTTAPPDFASVHSTSTTNYLIPDGGLTASSGFPQVVPRGPSSPIEGESPFCPRATPPTQQQEPQPQLGLPPRLSQSSLPQAPPIPPQSPPPALLPALASPRPSLPLPSLASKQKQRKQHRRSKPQRPCALRRRNLLALALASFLLSVVSIVCLTLKLFDKSCITPRAWQDSAYAEGVYEACVMCVSLQEDFEMSRAEEPYIKLLQTAKDEKLCCARTNKEMSTLIFLMTRRQKLILELEKKLWENPEKLAARPKPLQFTPVSAHISLHPYNMSDLKNPEQMKYSSRLTFDTKALETGEHSRRVKLTKNAMIIAHPGWYYIYASVRFMDKFRRKSSCENMSSKVWFSVIGHQQATSRKISELAVASTQCCDDCPERDVTTYIGGTFRLDRGDHVYVEVKGRGPVSDDQAASYLGIIMLGSTGEDNLVHDDVTTSSLDDELTPFKPGV